MCFAMPIGTDFYGWLSHSENMAKSVDNVNYKSTSHPRQWAVAVNKCRILRYLRP
jgi:hypothetical protein